MTEGKEPEAGCSVREYGWCARGDRIPLEDRVPFNRPTIRQVYDSLPFVRRYFIYWLKHVGKKEKLFINTFQPLKHKPHYGVPCGGIGCGSIGRDFRGGFCKFGLRPGLIEHKVDVLRADQFIVTLRRKNGEGFATVYQKVLCAAPTTPATSTELNAWDFSFPPDCLTYRGLYPRSWTRYDIREYRVSIVMRQISPVIPGDYRDSSLPVSVFVFDVENGGDEDLYVSITFTFRNGTGYHKWSQEGNCTSSLFESKHAHSRVEGVCLEHTISRMRCTYAVAANCNQRTTVSRCAAFDPSKSGDEIWQSLWSTGHLQNVGEVTPTRELAIAVCAQTIVKANSKAEAPMEFALAWDMPIVQFGARKRNYRRRYTRFFGDRGDAAPALCAHSLTVYEQWERRINDWQDPVLNHRNLPDWYKSALFNELYFMTDGGSVWFEFEEDWACEEQHLSPYSIALMKDFGRFGYLESWEYRMVNTYDVHFYASFALAQLWPSLEHVIQAEFTDQIEHFDGKPVIYHMEGNRGPKKSRTRVPHDLGNPAVDPWLLTNAYVMHDTGKWKDLNLKFILISFRDYTCVLGKDQRFLNLVWPAVKSLINEGLKNWDQDGDGMIENFGAADQTYDAWKMSGVSAYCGCLWLAALRAALVMAREVGDSACAHRYAETLSRAREAYITKLWNGEYYNFDERSRSRHTIMADQLCGYWFLQSISPELADELLPAAHVKSALNIIYNYNVLRFAGGRLGAVNGMRRDGTVDRNYIQADEMWTGVTYALAAFLIQQGAVQRGFDTAWGCYDGCFNRFGLQYQTPEALYEQRFYRAIGYMRPLSIWAMQWALIRHCDIFGPHSEDLSGIRTSTPTDFTPDLCEDEDEGYGHGSDMSSDCRRVPSSASVPSFER
uniref:Non-lysosomal glucosylceramidase n=2 Tax=Ascaris TaxID=6251 RepID=A0A9J2P6Z0_ASCLU